MRHFHIGSFPDGFRSRRFVSVVVLVIVVVVAVVNVLIVIVVFVMAVAVGVALSSTFLAHVHYKSSEDR